MCSKSNSSSPAARAPWRMHMCRVPDAFNFSICVCEVRSTDLVAQDAPASSPALHVRRRPTWLNVLLPSNIVSVAVIIVHRSHIL